MTAIRKYDLQKFYLQDFTKQTTEEASPNDRFGLNNKVWLGVWDGHDSREHYPYWGFKYDSFKKDSMPELYADIEKILNNVGIQMSDIETESNWVAWNYTKME